MNRPGASSSPPTSAVFTVIWDNSFGCYGLELYDRPINGFLARVGEPWGFALLPVSDHPR